MERDPLRLAWTTSRPHHGFAALLLAAAGVVLLAGLDLARVLLDEVAAGAPPSPLLRLEMTGLEMMGFSPLVVFEGIRLDPAAHAAAVLTGLAAVPLLIALLLAGVGWLSAAIGARVLARIRATVLDAVLGASAASREGAAEAASLAGDALSSEGGILGSAVLSPARAAGVIGLVGAFTLAVDWRVGLALCAMLAIAAVLNARRSEGRLEAARARRAEGAAADQFFQDLLRRTAALRAHGTRAFERERVRRELIKRHRLVEARVRRLGLLESLTAAVFLLTPLVVLGSGAWLSSRQPGLTPGSLLAVSLAAALAVVSVREITHWHRLLEQVRPLLAELGRGVAALQTREPRGVIEALPRAGALVARGVSGYDPASGGRISGVDLSLAFPAHVALVGDGDVGLRVLAALIGGVLEPSTGRLTYGGVDLATADPVERAQRIAFAGGDTVLMPGTLRQNLLYGCSVRGEEAESRLAEAIAIAGLDRLIHARGLAGTIDPAREPQLAAAIVESRRVVQAELTAAGLDHFVDPFDAGRYNHHATIGENLLFGKPIGDTFREDNLASHPFVRAVLEAEELTKPLTAVGLSIATSMIEIFADMPDGHPLFERFSFFSAADRPYFEDLVERRSAGRRGAEPGRDREHLIGLALRYSESRHRLGLLDDTLRQRLLAARADFSKMLPTSLAPAIEFYDADRLCSAASVQDNLLFGRIASDQAGAEDAVHAVIRRVLTHRGLDAKVSRIGLDGAIDLRGDDLTPVEVAAVDLVRCLVRRPDILVVERALDGLSGSMADGLVARLRRALVGRGLVVVTSRLSEAMDRPPLDAVLRFERGALSLDQRRIDVAEPIRA
jgi:ABC-type multidrug transport system fused ATPase/permease subunit